MSWYRIEFKRKHLTLGRYHGPDKRKALHYLYKWSEEVKKHPTSHFKVNIHTNDKTLANRLNQTV